ncbi:MAG: SPFH domain-containing protein [Thermomicrobiales bacterium]
MAIIDVIEYPNERSGELVHRIPENGSGDFALGSQLIVRESQQAVFYRDGKALDTFGPGRYTLETKNIPLLGGLINLPFGGRTPFTAEVYFVSMRDFTDLKWGSAQPLVYRDSELGMVRLRAFGTYSLRVRDPQLFVNQYVGQQGSVTTGSNEDFFRGLILAEFNDILGKQTTSILDIQGITKQIADGTRAALADDFARMGLELTSFQIAAVTPPEEVQQRIDERSGIAALGNMDDYTKFKTAQAIGDAAQNPGGAGDMASTGAGLGAGMAIGQAMAGSMTKPQGSGGATTDDQIAQLERLAELHKAGALTDQEFAAAKKRILG